MSRDWEEPMSYLAKAIPLFFGAVLPCFADAGSTQHVQPFSATCEEASARTFIESTDFEGAHTPGTWSHQGTTAREWHFKYEGGRQLVVDGENVQIIASHDGVLLAATYGSTGLGTNGWLYAVHRGLNKIVATTAGGYGGYDAVGSGVVISSIELRCTFSE